MQTIRVKKKKEGDTLNIKNCATSLDRKFPPSENLARFFQIKTHPQDSSILGLEYHIKRIEDNSPSKKGNQNKSFQYGLKLNYYYTKRRSPANLMIVIYRDQRYLLVISLNREAGILFSAWLKAFIALARWELVFRKFLISTQMARQRKFGSITLADTRNELSRTGSSSVTF